MSPSLPPKRCNFCSMVFLGPWSGSRREHQTSRRSIPSSFAGALGFFGRMVGWFNYNSSFNSKKLKISSEYQLILYLYIQYNYIHIYTYSYFICSAGQSHLQLMDLSIPAQLFTQYGCWFFPGDFDIRFGPSPTWSGEDQELVFFGKMI